MRSSSILFFALLVLELLLLARAAPYFAAPLAVPGRIEAEDYDRGGPGVAYFDTVRRTIFVFPPP